MAVGSGIGVLPDRMALDIDNPSEPCRHGEQRGFSGKNPTGGVV